CNILMMENYTLTQGNQKRVQIHLIMILKKKDIQIYMDQMVITISITMN
ncbi:Putative toxin component near putative ESAT-related proteins, repetitive / Repetitive hypothetical protein near ESAT cluster, SA0282 homolog, partial [Bacillus altitudinis]